MKSKGDNTHRTAKKSTDPLAKKPAVAFGVLGYVK
jgi:hypothetical protein